jgi:hypothetical protein
VPAGSVSMQVRGQSGMQFPSQARPQLLQPSSQTQSGPRPFSSAGMQLASRPGTMPAAQASQPMAGASMQPAQHMAGTGASNLLTSGQLPSAMPSSTGLPGVGGTHAPAAMCMGQGQQRPQLAASAPTGVMQPAGPSTSNLPGLVNLHIPSSTTSSMPYASAGLQGAGALPTGSQVTAQLPQQPTQTPMAAQPSMGTTHTPVLPSSIGSLNVPAVSGPPASVGQSALLPIAPLNPHS